MRNPQQAHRLMELSLRERTFIINSLSYIEEALEEHLHNYDGEKKRNVIRLELKDIFNASFVIEKAEKCPVVTKWKHTSHQVLEVPEEFKGKAWKEVFKNILFLNWLRSLKKELIHMGFSVSMRNNSVKESWLEISWFK